MKKSDKDKLLVSLAEWFKFSANNRNRWHNDPIGKLIKQELIDTSNWKKRSNGKSAARKGYQAMLYAKAVKLGYDGDQIQNL